MVFADFLKIFVKISSNRRFISENFTDFFRSFDKMQTIAGNHYLLHHFLEIREKMVQKFINF